MTTKTEIIPATFDSEVQLAVDKISESVQLGIEAASLSSTEHIMVALATGDRAWLPGSATPEKELWARMNRGQVEAITRYTQTSPVRPPKDHE